MVVIGTVQALSEYMLKLDEGTFEVADMPDEVPNEVTIDPDEFMLVLTLIAPKAVIVKANPTKAIAIIVTLENFLCAILYPHMAKAHCESMNFIV
jgi:hypothetical protein